MRTENAGQIRVLVVDDHPIVRMGVRAIIESQLDMVVAAEAASTEAAITGFPQILPDLTVMELDSEGVSGTACIKVLRRRFPETRFIVLTTFRGAQDIHRALEAGASGFLLKGMPCHLLLEAIRRVHAGETFLPAQISQALANPKPKRESSSRGRSLLALASARSLLTGGTKPRT